MLYVSCDRHPCSSSDMKLGSCLEYVCREHRLAFTFLVGPDRPVTSVIAAVLFFVGPPPDIR